MRLAGASLEFSATDLVGFLQCRHLTELDRAVARGEHARPRVYDDPMLEVLRLRGSQHERSYVRHLMDQGLDAVTIEGIEVTKEALAQTRTAMRRGDPVIVQAALARDGWVGRADILRRVEQPSAFGPWSYEACDTKLSRETKAGSVLQLCLYSELLGHEQNLPPEHMHIVVPWSDFVPECYRFAEYSAYFRKIRRAFLAAVNDAPERVYPEPVEFCDICRWQEVCAQRRRDDDHLCLVAGISKLQRAELAERGFATVAALARMPLPPPFKSPRGSIETYRRVREQARVFFEARVAGERKFELQPIEPGFGLTRLPSPDKGDIFLDLEGDPFVGEHGLEYLFGYAFEDEKGEADYVGDWSLTRGQERQAFETFIDFAHARWAKNPDMHIYHYAPYEPAALKRLMGRYATREQELDCLLRAERFVDLYQIVRRALFASVESYSIKKLEPFFGFVRATPLPEANVALTSFQAFLELGDARSISEQTKERVRSYNRDDCESALALRGWLEKLRSDEEARGADLPRPEPKQGDAPDDVSEWALRINRLTKKLTEDIPSDLETANAEQKARQLLANLLDWHRREEKAVWWDYFRLAGLPPEDLFDERDAIAGLEFAGVVGGTDAIPIHRYRFPVQETHLRGGEKLKSAGGENLGSVHAISAENGVVDIKKQKKTAQLHVPAVFAFDLIGTKVLAEALARLGEHVATHGILGEGAYQAARDLLLREGPRLNGAPLRLEGETSPEAAVRLCEHLESGVLAIQGPPGAGKTHTGAQMILKLVSLGKRVGIAANSHKVIRNLIGKSFEAADEAHFSLTCIEKTNDPGEQLTGLTCTDSNPAFFAELRHSHLGAGTQFLWSRSEARDCVDVLFVDEAAQMSLANVLALSQAAKTLVLIGDPQQLDQPTRGSHPDGAEQSALGHILGREQTISPGRGLFLAETWRLHPAICRYTSDVFYEGKLGPREGMERQALKNCAPLASSGLYYLPVDHGGNQSASPEEAVAIAKFVDRLLPQGASWITRDGSEEPIALQDVLIIAPYNAQVFEISKRLPGAHVGTVDKFQGQEAPIAIYSLATSSHADAPRGMEFLYSLNRLNVATSRARCASIIVASPGIFEAECRTPRQMKLANAFCRYLELAEPIDVA